MADNNLAITAYGLSTTGKGQNLDNMYLNGRYINVPTETSSKISKFDDSAFQVYGVSDSEIGVEGDRSVGLATGAIVMDMLLHTQNTMTSTGRIEKEAIWNDIVEASRATKDVRSQAGIETLGTSFAALLLHGNKGLAVHLGDSRIYVIRKGKTLQITDDHLESSDMFRLGILSQAQAEVHKASSRLTAYVGMDGIYDARDEAFSRYFIFYPGDTFILCSDGVTDAILNDKLERVTRLLKDATPEQIATTLMTAAGEHSNDDRTIIVLRVQGSTQEEPQTAPLRLEETQEAPRALTAKAPQAAPQASSRQLPSRQPAMPQRTAETEETALDVQEPTAESFRREQVTAAPAQRQQLSSVSEEKEGPVSTLSALIDKLMNDPKKMAMVVGGAVAVIILLIVIIAAIAKGGKNKKQKDADVNSSAPTTEMSTTESEPVTPVYEQSSTPVEESKETEKQTGVTSEFEYTVEEGDTLYDIVMENYESADLELMEALAAYNGFTMDEGIYAGEVLKIAPFDVLGYVPPVEEEESSEEESSEETEESTEEESGEE